MRFLPWFEPRSRPSVSIWWPAPQPRLAAVPELKDKLLVAGVVDGRNVWRTDLERALGNTGLPARAAPRR